MSAAGHDLTDRVLGAYLGAAIGDALGAPVEGWHAAWIKRIHGRVDRFLPYDPCRLHPGYALHPEPGSVTDDTYMRSAVAGFVLKHPDPGQRTPETFAAHMHANVDPNWCLPVRLEPLERIHAGEVTPYESAAAQRVGGIGAWWSVFGLIWAGRPRAAAEEARRLSVIWKRPFERDIVGATQAGVAVATTASATVDGVVGAMVEAAGPLGAKLLARAAELGSRHGDFDAFVEDVYSHLLVQECSTESDGPLPPRAVAQPANQRQGGNLLAEQIPLAVATLVFGRGDFVRTITTAASLGRDTDSHSSNCGALIGGLVGLGGIPKPWVETLVAANPELDLLLEARELAHLAALELAG